MGEEKIEEETYSLIFTSLKHPIRRRILRMLARKPLTYSEILEILNIDSGQLSYHLESLGDLTTHSKNGHYQLSSFGEATVKLMDGVEDHTPMPTIRNLNLREFLVKVYPVILVLTLIGASFHFVTYSTADLNLEISTPEGELFSGEFYLNENQINTIHSDFQKFSQDGIYIIRITDISEWDSLTCNLKFQQYEKPYFYLGLIVLGTALGYITLVTVTRLKRKEESK